ncbi:MAG TPA: hypothetical protein VIQ30_25810 [Pseudonocardia sp.]
MSRQSRLMAANGRIVAAPVKPGPSWPSLTRNSANVPGGISAVPLPGPLVAAGLTWAPEDAAPHASSIGYALALEMAGPS